MYLGCYTDQCASTWSGSRTSHGAPGLNSFLALQWIWSHKRAVLRVYSHGGDMLVNSKFCAVPAFPVWHANFCSLENAVALWKFEFGGLLIKSAICFIAIVSGRFFLWHVPKSESLEEEKCNFIDARRSPSIFFPLEEGICGRIHSFMIMVRPPCLFAARMQFPTDDKNRSEFLGDPTRTPSLLGPHCGIEKSWHFRCRIKPPTASLINLDVTTIARMNWRMPGGKVFQKT